MEVICYSRLLLLSVFGMILICGCEYIDNLTQPVPPKEMETTPYRVTLIYPTP